MLNSKLGKRLSNNDKKRLKYSSVLQKLFSFIWEIFGEGAGP